jgi:hypothetical protein
MNALQTLARCIRLTQCNLHPPVLSFLPSGSFETRCVKAALQALFEGERYVIILVLVPSRCTENPRSSNFQARHSSCRRLISEQDGHKACHKTWTMTHCVGVYTRSYRFFSSSARQVDLRSTVYELTYSNPIQAVQPRTPFSEILLLRYQSREKLFLGCGQPQKYSKSLSHTKKHYTYENS